jgi:hypothetical protein
VMFPVTEVIFKDLLSVIFDYSVVFHSFFVVVCRDSSVGIATRYGLDVSDIESRWRRGFPHPSNPALGPTHFGYRVFPGFKSAGRGVDYPPYLAPRLKKE